MCICLLLPPLVISYYVIYLFVIFTVLPQNMATQIKEMFDEFSTTKCGFLKSTLALIFQHLI